MVKIYKGNEFMEYPKEKKVYSLSVKAIPVERLLTILPKPYNETMEDSYSQGFEDGWNACLKAIKEELDYWEGKNGKAD